MGPPLFAHPEDMQGLGPLTDTVRAAEAADLPSLIAIMRGTEMFVPDEIEGFAEATAAHFEAPEEGHRWSVAEAGGVVTGAAYLAPEMPRGVFNLLFVGVAPDRRRAGVASALLAETEAHLRGIGARLLLVDTSSGSAFVGAWALYDGCGYEEAARIRDYWAPGEDKITFRKAL